MRNLIALIVLVMLAAIPTIAIELPNIQINS